MLHVMNMDPNASQLIFFLVGPIKNMGEFGVIPGVCPCYRKHVNLNSIGVHVQTITNMNSPKKCLVRISSQHLLHETQLNRNVSSLTSVS